MRLRLSNFPYIANIQHLELYGDLIEILNGFTNTSPNKFVTLTTYSSTRGHNMKLYNTRRRLNVAKFFFPNSVVTLLEQLT